MAKQTLSEEQPRYVIDDEVREKEIKILSKEQNHALSKLMKAAGHFLSEEERDLISQLQQKLNKETERVQSLRKLTITDKPLDEYLSDYQKGKKNEKKKSDKGNRPLGEDDDSESESHTKSAPSIKHIVGFKPDEVVRRYIECWNQQKFGAEYDCFSRDFLRHDRDAYINARHLSYQQNLNSGGLKINFIEILSNEVYGGEAEIVASKTVQLGNRKPQEEIDKYRLKLEKGRWLIYAVEPFS
ncbi:MAG: hypothetical protein JXR73_10570 [Candidatus Omnitrophica bacterium]|nr:hypothetical protein [Candidatus Omnitrophota bacterium]